MGRLMRAKVQYLYRDKDRHGNVRFYVCVPGRNKVRIREEYETPAFWAAYTAAIGGAAPRKQVEDTRTLAWLVKQYYQSAAFRQLGERTRYVRRRLLERICERDGDKPYKRLEAKHVEKRRDEMSERPEAANGYIKALRQLYRWASSRNVALVDHNPAAEVSYFRGSRQGFHTWSRGEVAQFVERHPLGTKAHLALCILLYSGVRRSDAVKLGRQMIWDGWIHFTETKGADRYMKERALPVLPELQSAIDAAPSGHLTLLVTAFGKPFTSNGFGNWFRKRCNEAGLPQCSAHGLRKAGATIAAENGATEHELMAIYGWESPKQAEVYTRTANRRILAGKAMHRVNLGTGDEQKVSHFPIGGRKEPKAQ